MKTLHIIVSNKVASYLQRDGYIVCGNSGYQVEFTFDTEWDAYTTKTARFIWSGKYKDVEFSGNVCPVPIVANTEQLEVGVYVENLSTTTSAVIPCRKSILCHSDIKSEGTVVVPEGTPVLGEATITENGEHYPGEGYDGFYKVTVKVAEGGEIPEGYIKPTGTKTITENGTHDVTEYASVEVEVESEGEVVPEFTEVDDFAVFAEADGDGSLLVGYDVSQKVALPAGSPARLASVSDEDFIANNIRKGKNIFGLEGAFEGESSGGGAELNIAYGDTAPEDTSKLWVKTSEPSAVKVAKSAQYVEVDGSATIETMAPLSVSTGNAIVGAVGSKIYVIGGFQASGTYIDTIQCYDTETQTATTLSATVDVQISASAYATIGTKIYFAGGWESQNVSGIRCFDTETQTVTNLGHTEITGHGKCADAVGKKMYIFTETTDIYVYDTEADVLSKMSTTFPVSVQYKTARAVETKIYIVGGDGSNKIYCFDTETEVVTQLSTTLPSAIQGLGLAEHNGCLYVFGGKDASNTVLNTIHFIDVSHDTLSTLSTTLPNAIYRVGLAKVDDTIYIMGGLTSGTSSTPNVVSFVPGMVMAVATNELFILSALQNYFSIVKTDNIDVELGISGVFKGNADGIGEEVEAALHNGTSWVTI